jgi:hypothetical protein
VVAGLFPIGVNAAYSARSGRLGLLQQRGALLMPLTEHPQGNYRFLPGIAPYSCGVVAAEGFEIVRVVLPQMLPLAAGFEQILYVLESHRRSRAALCAVELRSPRPYTFQGFSDFNAGYADVLRGWGVFVNGINPVARTNVAPVVDPPSEPSLYAFSFTRLITGSALPTFVVAGSGELPEGMLQRDAIIALADITPAGLARKAAFVMDLMENRLRGLGVDWNRVRDTNVYTAHSITPLLPEVLLARMGSAARHGVHWHYTRPPIGDIEFEMDLRNTCQELLP